MGTAAAAAARVETAASSRPAPIWQAASNRQAIVFDGFSVVGGAVINRGLSQIAGLGGVACQHHSSLMPGSNFNESSLPRACLACSGFPSAVYNEAANCTVAKSG